MRRRPCPPRNGRGSFRARRAEAAATLALALVATPGCLLAYRTPSTIPPTEVPAPAAVVPPSVPEARSPEHPFDEPDVAEGVFHVVQAGQTLWRIARSYGVPVRSIVEANGLVDPASIEVGSALFVPGAHATIDVAPYPAPAPRRPDFRPPPGEREWIWPLTGDVLSRFGDHRRRHTHRGVDIRGRRGEEIVATRSGRVVFSGRGGGGYGLTVVIDHGDGQQSLYAHNESLLVAVGDEVRQGQPVARCGRTGNATTEHVHFEIRTHDEPEDPLPLLGEIFEARR